MKHTFLFFFILLTALFACENSVAEGYEIKVKINHLNKNDTIFLAYHMGSQKYLRDTAILDDKLTGVFSGEKDLLGGIYLIVLPNKNYFDIIVNEQRFSIENDTTQFTKNFKSTNTKENEIFYEDLKFITQKGAERSELDAERKLEITSEARKKILEEEMRKIDTLVMNHRKEIIKQYPKTFYASVLRMMQDIELPESPKDENGNLIDSNFLYGYYKHHYFDHIDFSDDRLLRTPVLHNKVMYYVEKFTPQTPDSINAALDIILEKAQANNEVFKYWLIELLNYYAKSNIMGFDAVYVHLVENYYAKGKADWTDEADLYRITDRAQKLKPTLIGQITPPLVLRDLKGNVIDLYNVKSEYTLLFIYDPDCGHCKKETPKMLEAYNKIVGKGIDIKTFAVSTYHLVDGQDSTGRPKLKTKEADLNKWPTFVKEFKIENWINVADLYLQNNFREEYDISSTPRAFLLDKNKKILAKRFAAEQLEQIVDDFYKRDHPSTSAKQ